MEIMDKNLFNGLVYLCGPPWRPEFTATLMRANVKNIDKEFEKMSLEKLKIHPNYLYKVHKKKIHQARAVTTTHRRLNDQNADILLLHSCGGLKPKHDQK